MAVVEDHGAFRHALGRMLHADGFDPVLFGSAEEFLETSRDLNPLCLVVDVGLPGLSGLQLQQRLRAEGDSPPIIVMTSYRDAAIRRLAEENGCAAFLLKPFGGTTLLAAIASIAIWPFGPLDGDPMRGEGDSRSMMSTERFVTS